MPKACKNEIKEQVKSYKKTHEKSKVKESLVKEEWNMCHIFNGMLLLIVARIQIIWWSKFMKFQLIELSFGIIASIAVVLRDQCDVTNSKLNIIFFRQLV